MKNIFFLTFILATLLSTAQSVSEISSGVGPTGPTGAGITGPTGPTGTSGGTGATGATGTAGTNGITGATGPTGSVGSLTTTGNSGAATLVGTTLNVPNYTLSGLGGLAASEGTYTPTDSLASAGLTIVHAPVSWSRTGNTVTIHGILYLSQTIISPIVDTFQISLPVGTTLGINGAQSGMINSAANVGAALAGGGGIYGNVSKKLTVTISVFATISSLQCFFIAYYSLQ